MLDVGVSRPSSAPSSSPSSASQKNRTTSIESSTIPDANGTPTLTASHSDITNSKFDLGRYAPWRFKLGGAQSVTAEYDDRKFNGSHYGHICMARIAEKGITLTDQKGLAVARPEGATGEPPAPAGRKNVTFPLSLDPET